MIVVSLREMTILFQVSGFMMCVERECVGRSLCFFDFSIWIISHFLSVSLLLSLSLFSLFLTSLSPFLSSLPLSLSSFTFLNLQELGGSVSYLSKQLEQLLYGLLGHSAYPVRRAGELEEGRGR